MWEKLRNGLPILFGVGVKKEDHITSEVGKQSVEANSVIQQDSLEHEERVIKGVEARSTLISEIGDACPKLKEGAAEDSSLVRVRCMQEARLAQVIGSRQWRLLHEQGEPTGLAENSGKHASEPIGGAFPFWG